MSQHPLDKPEVVDNLFYPRRATMGQSTPDLVFYDGLIPVDDEADIAIGYRLYPHPDEASETIPLILFFHGNGEIAPDYDNMADAYHTSGVSLLIVDYRGYGWSTGKTLTSTMLSDAAVALEAIPDMLAEHGLNTDIPLFVKGRSLGSAPAIYLAQQFPKTFKGLILDSAYADAPSLFRRMGISLDTYQDDDALPINNLRKMKVVNLPLLVIHGEQDALIPVQHGLDLYAASPSTEKTLLTIPRAGHNNILLFAMREYFDALTVFVAKFAG